MQVLGVDFNQGDVGVSVGADHCGVVGAVVVQGDFELLGSVDHMVVGDDVSIFADDHTRTTALGLRVTLLLLLLSTAALCAAIASETGAKEELKRIPVVVVLLPLGLETLDAHHAVDGVFSGNSEVGSRGNGACRCRHKSIAGGGHRLLFGWDEGVHIHAGALQCCGGHQGGGRAHDRCSNEHDC